MPSESREEIHLEPVGIVGFGSIGRALAENLRDSGLEVVVSGRDTGRGRQEALRSGFTWRSLSELATLSSVVLLTLPDDVMDRTWEELRARFPASTVLVFCHGWVPWKRKLRESNGTYGLLAPKGAGSKLRSAYLEGTGLYMVIDWFGQANESLTNFAERAVKRLAKAGGGRKQGIIRVPVEDECRADLMSEQAVLCGGLPALWLLAADWMQRQGVDPRLAWIELIHESRLICEMTESLGLKGMYEHISAAARYGGDSRGQWIRDNMSLTLERIGKCISEGAFFEEMAQNSSPQTPTLPETNAARYLEKGRTDLKEPSA